MGLFNFIYRSLRKSSLRQCLHGNESWALVTGGSDGIGKGFVEELLLEGFNVFIHGRNASKLDSLANELRSKYRQRQIEILCFDAGNSDVINNVKSMVSQIGDRQLSVLINNVGYHSNWTPFIFQNVEEQLEIIRVQSSFPTLLISSLLPILARNQPSLILNIGGLTSQYPCPLLAVHSGAKAYFVTFTEGLAEELKQYSIWLPSERRRWLRMIDSSSSASPNSNSTDINNSDNDNIVESSIAQKPQMYIHAINVHNVSSSSNHSSTSLFVPTARTMARAALNVVGCGEVFVTAYWAHAMLGAVLGVLPRGFVEGAIGSASAKLRGLDLEKKMG